MCSRICAATDERELKHCFSARFCFVCHTVVCWGRSREPVRSMHYAAWVTLYGPRYRVTEVWNAIQCQQIRARAPNTRIQSCAHTCHWPSCEVEASVSQTRTESYRQSFGSVITVNLLNHEQSISVIRPQFKDVLGSYSLLCVNILLVLMCLLILASHSPLSSLIQVKCCMPTTALQGTDSWACSWSRTCGFAMLCWSPWSTTLRSSPSMSLSSPHTHYGEPRTAPPPFLRIIAAETVSGVSIEPALKIPQPEKKKEIHISQLQDFQFE